MTGSAPATRPEVSALAGSAALPRQNGELVFDEPWESRAFGLAVTASEAGAFDWEDFRRQLIGEIEAWEAMHGREHEEGGEWRYYARWLASLEHLLAERGLVDPDELAARAAALREADAHEHDHDHDHHHDHGKDR